MVEGREVRKESLRRGDSESQIVLLRWGKHRTAKCKSLILTTGPPSEKGGKKRMDKIKR